MKKIFDYIIFFCLLVLVMSAVMFVMAEYPARLWVAENKEFIENIANREPDDPTRGDTRYSALILSFNQNEKPDTFGPKKSKFHYDFEGKGVSVKTGWARPTAGMLVIDRDGGPKLLGYDGSNACGFDFLAGADANSDGRIDAQDPIWSDLKLWMDKNSNGRIDEIDELEIFSLPDMNITSLELKRNQENKYLIDGNFIREAGAFHYNDQADRVDRTGRLDEIFLRQHSRNVKFAKPIDVPQEIAAAVPDIPGGGLMRSLREAAVLNPDLVPLAARLLNTPDDGQRWACLDELMTAWAKTGGLDKTLQERVGDRYKLVDDGLGGPDGAELASRLAILDAWSGHHLFLLPHELNPVQQIFEPVISYNSETGEISFDYQPVRENIDKIYYKTTDRFYRNFFPDSDSIRPGTEDLFQTGKEDDPAAAR